MHFRPEDGVLDLKLELRLEVDLRTGVGPRVDGLQDHVGRVESLQVRSIVFQFCGPYRLQRECHASQP